MASFIPTLVAVLALFAALPTAFSRCSHSSHCDSGNPLLIDMCSHRLGLCLSLPHPSARQDEMPMPPQNEIIITTLERLVSETNAIDFPFKEKIDVIETIKKVYEGFNPHKFLHQNLLGIEFPAALDSLNIGQKTSNVEFFDKMVNTFQLMDDKHSVFFLPYPFNSSFATLGFSPKIFYDNKSRTPTKRRYVVVDTIESVIPVNSSFGRGSEVLTFDGKPIDDVIVALGKDSYGSNSAAQIDSALDILTFRFLLGEPIPFKTSVKVGYVNPDGEKGSVLIDWLFVEIRRPDMADAMMRQFTPRVPGPFQLKKHMLIPEEPTKNSSVGPETINSNVRVVDKGRTPIPVKPKFKQSFEAEILSTQNGPIGHFVLSDFASDVTGELVGELSRVLKLMPKTGMIMDLRGNGGGRPDNIKILVELLTGRSPPQIPTVVRATQLMKDAFDSIPAEFASKELLTQLSAYRGAIETAFNVGESFSGPSAGLFSSQFVGSTVPRAYFGPIVTLVDGLCYSAGDIFAALQKDLGYSLLIGVSDNVGAGGATTFTYQDLLDLFPAVLKPTNARFSTSFSRIHRSGLKEGAILENFGVKPDIRYYPTLDDALNNDCDLYEFLSQILQKVKK